MSQFYKEVFYKNRLYTNQVSKKLSLLFLKSLAGMILNIYDLLVLKILISFSISDKKTEVNK